MIIQYGETNNKNKHLSLAGRQKKRYPVWGKSNGCFITTQQPDKRSMPYKGQIWSWPDRNILL